MDLEKRYLAHRENFKVTFDLAGDYAKWLLSTLLLLNSGAIAGIFQKDVARTFQTALCFFALGVLFALISGVIGWFNLQIAAGHYHFSSADILEGKKERAMPNSLAATRRSAVLAAIVSIVCLMLGAIFVLWTLQ